MNSRRPHEENRWRGRPLQSLLLRAVTLVAPVVASVLTAFAVTAALPKPTSYAGLAMWWLVVTGTATAVLLVVDRLARRLLPLAALLRMTMLFPDAAPKRYAVARKAGGVTDLERRLEAARHHGVGGDAVEAAERILVLVTALSNHDRRTRGHSERTHLYTDLLAKQMGVPTDDRDRLRWAALVHDIGKLEVPEEVLNKPGRPDEDEWAVLQSHPDHGARICEPLRTWLGPWWHAIGQHHERWDGGGYPGGLAGTEISLAARIVSVADAYEVMTANRPYQRAMSHEGARQELVRCAGTQFDPAVVRAFLAISLDELRVLAGPVSWFSQIPVLRHLLDILPRLQGAGLFAAQATATAGVAGVAAVTLGAFPGVPQVGAAPPPVPVEAPAEDHVAASDSAPDIVPAPPLPEPQVEVAGPLADPVPATPPRAPEPDRALPRPTPGPAPAAPPASPVAAPSAAPVSPAPATPAPTSPAPTPTSSPAPAPSAPPPAAPAPVAPARAPMATDPSRTLDAGTSAALAADELATDPDDDLDAGSLAVTTRPSHGTAEVRGGVLRYTAADGWSGEDAVRYEVCDRTGLCAAGTVHLTVRPVPPVAEPVAATTRKGEPVDIDVLGPDAAEDLAARVVDQPAQGRAEALDSRRLRYTPNAGFSGTDTFGYAVCDAAARCSEALVTVTVTQVAPAAADDTATTLEDTPVAIDVLANDAAGTAPLDLTSLAVITEPERGDVLISDGGLRYVPGKDLHGPDALTYRICDEDGLCADAQVGITVQPVDDAPVAVDDRAYTTAGTPVTIAVLANDHDVDGQVLHVELGPAPATGTRTLTGDRVTFSDDGPGTVTFTYQACNAAACSAPATVTVAVDAAGEEEEEGTTPTTYPVATSDSATTYPNKPIAVAVLDNDVLVDDAGNRLAVDLAVASPPNVGSAAVDGETLVYTPGGTNAALGVQTMTYEVCFAGTTRCAVATLSVTVVREPPPPSPPTAEAEPPQEIDATTDAVAPSWVRIVTAAAEGDPGADAPAPVTPDEAATPADPAAGDVAPETDAAGAPPAPTDPVPAAPAVEPPPAVPPRTEVDDPAPEAGTSPVTDEPPPADEPLPTEESSTAEAPAQRTDPDAAPTS